MASFILKPKYEYRDDVIKIVGTLVTDGGKTIKLMASAKMTVVEFSEPATVSQKIDELIGILKSKIKTIQVTETENRRAIPTAKYNAIQTDITDWIGGGMV